MMRFIFLITILSFTINMQAQTLLTAKNSGLHYLVKQPIVRRNNPPVVFLLHGVGSNEEDLFSFANQFPSHFLVISVRAPYTLQAGSYAWYHLDYSSGKPVFDIKEEEQSRLKLINLINELKQVYAFNEKAVYLCGFSQGAIMSYAIGLTKPELIKGAMIMSGRLLEEIKPLIQKTDELKKIKIFISHGTSDPVLSIDYARSANTYLKTLGVTPSYHEYKDVHTINAAMLKDMLAWLDKN